MASCWGHSVRIVMRAGWVGMCVVALAVVGPMSACAQSSRMSPEELNKLESYTHVPPDVKAFAAAYVAAYNSKDPGRVMALNVPEWRACITPANKDVYDELLRQLLRDPITPGYLLSLMPVNEGNLKALARQAYFPVKPERELHIDWQYPNTNDGDQVVLYLAHQNGRWMTDSPCMTAMAIKDYRDAAVDREKYKAQAAAIKEPLRSELLAMVGKHQLGEAEQLYQKAAGCDMKTAMLVVNALAGNMP